MTTLCLCLHVKNEAERLPGAIGSFEGIADEVVVVDTGSTDETASLAAAMGARVFEFPWSDSFAAVRNFTFAQAQSDWLFHLDADEQLRPESRTRVRDIIEDDRVQAAHVLREDLHDLDRPEEFTEMWQLRLYRRRNLPVLVGRCHPQFVPSLDDMAAKAGRQVVHSDIRLRHDGYDRSRQRAKLERGARLMRLELAERPGQFYYLAELARTLLAIGDPGAPQVLAEAVTHLEKAFRKGQPPPSAALTTLETLLTLADEHRPHEWPIERIASLVETWFPQSAPLHWQLARHAFAAGAFAVAKARLESVRQLSERGDYDRTVSFAPSILGDELWLNLGACQMELGDPAGAAQNLRKVRPGSEFYDCAQANLRDLGAD